MQFRFIVKKISLVVMLFMGNAVSAFGATAADGAAQAKPAAYDFSALSASKGATPTHPGKEGKIKISVHAAVKVAQMTDKGELKQKLDFADMTIHKSEAAKRIMASANAEAKTKHKDAQDRLAASLSAFNAGDLALAKVKIDEAMKLMTDAARLVPSEFMLDKAKTKYEELLHGIKGLEALFVQNYEIISKEGGAKNLQPLDSTKISNAMDEAKALFIDGKYDKANEILDSLQDEVTVALNKMLANRTISYEMRFETTEQEYIYELARYKHFEELIPLAIEQKQPTKHMLVLMEGYVRKGKAKHDQAAVDAKKKNFAAALEKIKNASDDIESGLKIIGVRY